MQVHSYAHAYLLSTACKSKVLLPAHQWLCRSTLCCMFAALLGASHTAICNSAWMSNEGEGRADAGKLTVPLRAAAHSQKNIFCVLSPLLPR